jgi:hypothetical protein
MNLISDKLRLDEMEDAREDELIFTLPKSQDEYDLWSEGDQDQDRFCNFKGDK